MKFFEFLGRFGWEDGYGKLENRNAGMIENFVASLGCVWQGRWKGGKKNINLNKFTVIHL